MIHTLHAGSRQIDLSTPVCMGIINATPDSFSDGAQLASDSQGLFQVDIDKAIACAAAMVEAGAAFIDVGGESTRPGASAVSVDEELARVIPVIEAITSRLDVCVSVDTSSGVVMAQAIAAGAQLVNDVRALTADNVLEVVASSRAAVCLMHMRGQPSTMQEGLSVGDVNTELTAFLAERVKAVTEAGISSDRVLVDPGFGFGKSVQQNYSILKNLPRLQALNLPILVGISRKSMIGAVTGRPVDQRLAGSIAATSLALLGGAQIIRSHDVAATVDAIRVNSAFSDA